MDEIREKPNKIHALFFSWGSQNPRGGTTQAQAPLSRAAAWPSGVAARPSSPGRPAAGRTKEQPAPSVLQAAWRSPAFFRFWCLVFERLKKSELWVCVFVEIWDGKEGPNPSRALWVSWHIFVILSSLCSSFFFIFVLSCDPVFPEFEPISSNDFWGIVLCLGEFYLTKIWERFVRIWVEFRCLF
jgi:hypothetical protein